MHSAPSVDDARERIVDSGERASTRTDRCDATRESRAQTQREEVIYVDATKFVPIVAEDRFHPGNLAKVLIDPEEIASVQLLGYGNLSEFGECPVVQLNYMNGQLEQVFDAYRVWAQ